jgi:hypothetical protein
MRITACTLFLLLVACQGGGGRGGGHGGTTGNAGSVNAGGSTCTDDDDDGECTTSDCDDNNAAVNHDATESCNGIDDNCDDHVDEEIADSCGLTCEKPSTGCEAPAEVRVGTAHSCVLTDAGNVLCWGSNSAGALGIPDLSYAPFPIQVPGAAGGTALDIDGSTTCMHRGGDAVCWGGGVGIPFLVALPTGVSKLRVSANRLFTLDDAGELAFTELLGDAPGVQPFASGIADFDANSETVCAVSTAGALSCWDAMSEETAVIDTGAEGVWLGSRLCTKVAGELLCGSTTGTLAPVVGNGSATDVVTSAMVSCARNDAGRVACWDGDPPNDLGDVTQVAAGDLHSCALRNSGEVVCWGSMVDGAVGNGHIGPGNTSPNVEVVAPGPALHFPLVVLGSSTPFGACDSGQDMPSLLRRPGAGYYHLALRECDTTCEARLDQDVCLAECIGVLSLSPPCLQCFVDFAACTGEDCYDAFNTCTGFRADFAVGYTRVPRFECEGLNCYSGGPLGAACTFDDDCMSGSCQRHPYKSTLNRCMAPSGSSCGERDSHCDCSGGYCSCSGQGMAAGSSGSVSTCYRDCTSSNYCYPTDTCRFFADSDNRYCDPQ